MAPERKNWLPLLISGAGFGMLTWYYKQQDRSGHNGADSKTATLQPSAKPAKALVFKGFGLI